MGPPVPLAFAGVAEISDAAWGPTGRAIRSNPVRMDARPSELLKRRNFFMSYFRRVLGAGAAAAIVAAATATTTRLVPTETIEPLGT